MTKSKYAFGELPILKKETVDKMKTDIDVLELIPAMTFRCDSEETFDAMLVLLRQLMIGYASKRETLVISC